jgi:hypothetical protein
MKQEIVELLKPYVLSEIQKNNFSRAVDSLVVANLSKAGKGHLSAARCGQICVRTFAEVAGGRSPLVSSDTRCSVASADKIYLRLIL